MMMAPPPADLFNLVNRLDSLTDSLNNWKAEEISYTVAQSESDNTELTINIAETLGFNVRNRFKSENDDVYYLPKVFNCNDEKFRKENLVPTLLQACYRAGFRGYSKGWAKSKSKGIACWKKL